jgi:hypothetical protein
MLEFGSDRVDTVTNAKLIVSAIMVFMLNGYSIADELTDATEELCDTIKSCALEAVAGPGLTEELQEEMAPVLENSCTDIRGRVQAVSANHSLFQPAVGCLRSMATLSCERLHNAGLVKTPECTEYDRLATPSQTEFRPRF